MMNEHARYGFTCKIHVECKKNDSKIQFICLLSIHRIADSLNPIFIISHDENKDGIENNRQAPTD